MTEDWKRAFFAAIAGVAANHVGYDADGIILRSVQVADKAIKFIEIQEQKEEAKLDYRTAPVIDQPAIEINNCGAQRNNIKCKVCGQELYKITEFVPEHTNFKNKPCKANGLKWEEIQTHEDFARAYHKKHGKEYLAE